MARPTIPGSPEELTPEWLTRVLSERGVLSGEPVRGWREETLGEGEGFVGRISRLHLDVDSPEASSLRTVVAKFPTEHERNRALGEMTRAYEREIRFYEELARDVTIATPLCFHGEMEPDPAAAAVPAIEWLLARLPVALLAWLVRPLLWLGSRNRRRYVLILEDLAPARTGDQVAGCSREDAERVLRALAATHAGFWQSPRLDELSWLVRFDATPNFLHALFRRVRPRFAELVSVALPGWTPQLSDWLDANGRALLAHLGSPPVTLLHGDYRLDNLFFGRDGAPHGVAAVDWQAAGLGRGAFDVAYFLSGNLDPELALECEVDLVRAYCDELATRGVEDYPFERCWRDYELSKLYLVYRMITGIELIDLSRGRGAQLLDRSIERLFARLPEYAGLGIG